MINLQEYTPDIYYNESRDFQFIGRLYDLVLNYIKTNTDTLYNLPFSDNSDDQFVELLSLTLGFQPKHRYTSKHLRAICSTFSDILRNKGTIKALVLACNAIFHSEGIDQELSYELTNNNTNLILYLPTDLKDTTLLTDIIAYVLPAGMSCNIIKVIQINNDVVTKVDVKNIVTIFGRGDKAAINHNNRLYLYNNNKLARLPRYTTNASEADRDKAIIWTGDAIRALAEDTQGILANSTVFKPEVK